VEYKAEWWSIDMLPEWGVSEDEECTSFFASPQLGVLQVSAARKPTEDVTQEDIAEFAYDSQIPSEAIRPVSASHVSGLYAEYEEDGRYWRQWWLKGKSVLLFVTYNVAPEDKDSESAAIDALISSLRITA
jgi:hypothetical protein